MSMEEMKTQCHQLRESFQKLRMEVEIKNEVLQQNNQTLNTRESLYKELSKKNRITMQSSRTIRIDYSK